MNSDPDAKTVHTANAVSPDDLLRISYFGLDWVDKVNLCDQTSLHLDAGVGCPSTLRWQTLKPLVSPEMSCHVAREAEVIRIWNECLLRGTAWVGQMTPPAIAAAVGRTVSCFEELGSIAAANAIG